MLRRILMAALLAIPVATLAVPAEAGGPTTAKTFYCTTREKVYRIPRDATSLDIVAIGATGGNGGRGAKVEVTLNVSALPTGTSKLYVEVGCSPNSKTLWQGGWNGGGTGWYGGGGASDIRLTSRATALTTSDTRLLVAGGGGGDGACSIDGGASGNTSVSWPGNGGTGSDTEGCSDATAGGDGGYTGSHGGYGGAGAPSYNPDGNGGDGSRGQGGSVPYGSSYGGGGGGGFWGGGAGGDGGYAGGGGGAGDSYWNAVYATSGTLSADDTAIPLITITPVFPV